jgi:hypothetical protein
MPAMPFSPDRLKQAPEEEALWPGRRHDAAGFFADPPDRQGEDEIWLPDITFDNGDTPELWENSFSTVLIIIAASGLLLALACPVLIDGLLLHIGSG